MSRRREGRHIGFVSTRFAGTDGVSLESTKWAHMFESFGHTCYWFAGELDKPAEVSMLVPEAFFNTEANLDLNSKIFGDTARSRLISDEITRRKEFLKDRLYDFIEQFGIDLIIAENCLAIPMHIPLGIALTEVIAETAIPTIGHHHDLWWERPRFLLNSVRDIISGCFPPDLPSVRHVVINSMIQSDLAAKRGLSSTVVYNVIDFDAPANTDDEYTREFRRDLGFTDDDVIILQPTRVVARKGIEQALFLVKRLGMPNVKLVVSHSPGDEGSEYAEWLVDTARQQDVELHMLHNRFHETRGVGEKGEKIYSLWDAYPHADLVTYPSLYEGFGNAFLEAIYYRKPLLVNRYSVYITDIEPKGFDVISIDGFLTNTAVEQVREVIEDESRRREMVEKNFELGRRFFSYPVLRRRLGSLFSSFYGET